MFCLFLFFFLSLSLPLSVFISLPLSFCPCRSLSCCLSLTLHTLSHFILWLGIGRLLVLYNVTYTPNKNHQDTVSVLTTAKARASPSGEKSHWSSKLQPHLPWESTSGVGGGEGVPALSDNLSSRTCQISFPLSAGCHLYTKSGKSHRHGLALQSQESDRLLVTRSQPRWEGRSQTPHN